ncbi:uncharacterized protein EV154DRAFT_534363 [Mucor mucedo]|uniref:uncharacterized protein n=1 Tax=Mucor mucedo TaxID=29922 RepID=UPI002220FDCE|nr:uncharacterized protein EV154DRAFT_534363 [Mucor mucedo]KAI7864008.1 hypothetical protein EV154DRAFT_534363 [Mucor mucedo]
MIHWRTLLWTQLVLLLCIKKHQQLSVIDGDEHTCPHCNEFRNKNQNNPAPAITTIIMSVGYMLAQTLAETKNEGSYAV